MGATAAVLIAFWPTVPISDQFLKRSKFSEPQVLALSWFVAYTRCWPLYMTWVKSLSEAQLFFGFDREPLEVQRYVDGRGQEVAFCATTTDADASSRVPADTMLKSVLRNLIVAFSSRNDK